MNSSEPREDDCSEVKPWHVNTFQTNSFGLANSKGGGDMGAQKLVGISLDESPGLIVEWDCHQPLYLVLDLLNFIFFLPHVENIENRGVSGEVLISTETRL